MFWTPLHLRKIKELKRYFLKVISFDYPFWDSYKTKSILEIPTLDLHVGICGVEHFSFHMHSIVYLEGRHGNNLTFFT